MMWRDDMHPNNDGHEAIANAVIDELTRPVG